MKSTENQSSEFPVTSTEVSTLMSTNAAPISGHPAGHKPWLVLLLIVSMVGTAGVGAFAWQQKQIIDRVARESVRRIDDLDRKLVEAQIAFRDSAAKTQDTFDRLAVLDSKVAESQNQQAALEQLYQQMVSNDDSRILSEVEQTLFIASQQLQLAGNVTGGIAALEVAQARLAHANRPEFKAVSLAMDRDLEHLKAFPALDVPAMIGKLDQLMMALDRMPLLTDTVPTQNLAILPEPAAVVEPVGKSANWWDKSKSWFKQAKNALLFETRDLVKVQSIDNPDVLLLSPDQGQMLRANLKLRVLNARFALLSRQKDVWQSDLEQVDLGVKKYFDAQADSTVHVLSLLTQLRSAEFSVVPPNINDSLKTVHSLALRSGSKPATP